MIVLAHVVFFTALFLELPAFGVATTSGGIITAFGLAIAAEAVVIIAAVAASLFNKVIGLNPLVQRKTTTLVSQAFIFGAFTLFLLTLRSFLPTLFSVTGTWLLLMPAIVCVGLEIMLRIKRYLIATSN